jgi:hypothetical protein
MNDAQTPGQIAYAAYRQVHATYGNIHLRVAFADLPDIHRRAWEAAAQAVLDSADFPPLDLGAREEDPPC